MFRELQKLGGGRNAGKIRPLPMLNDSEGNPAESFHATQQILFDQFARIEGGRLVDAHELWKVHESQQEDQAEDWDESLMPRVRQVQSVVRKMKRGKVPAPNGITTDLVKAGGIAFLHQILPLLSKCVVKCTEPLTWKGGQLIALFIGKGDVKDAASYRSMFISDTTAKVFHAHLRQHLEKAWEATRQTLQFGGCRGGSTDMAHHILHAGLAWARHRNIPCAAIFVDLSAAFYSVLRQGLFEGEIYDRHVCRVMSDLGITPEEYHDILSTVEKEAATHGISKHADHLFRNLFTATHFYMQDIPHACHTARGTRPGDPVADVLFNMSMSLILRATKKHVWDALQLPNLGDEGKPSDLCEVERVPHRAYADVAFVDDCVFLTHGASNEQVIQQVTTIQGVFHDEARRRGLSVNYQSGKTEVIMQCAGKGKRKFQHKLWCENEGCVTVLNEFGTSQLRFVHTYKHLGAHVQAGANITWDRLERTAQASKAWGMLRHSFYSKKQVSTSNKVMIWNSLTKSRAMYNTHVWSWISDSEISKWNDVVREMIYPLVRNQLDGNPSFVFQAAELCGLAGALDLHNQLHANRLKYLVRMIDRAPKVLWQFILHNNADQAWGEQLGKSFKWLCEFCPGKVPYQHGETVQDLIAKAAVDQQLRARVKKAEKAAVRYYQRRAEGHAWAKSFENKNKMQRIGCALPADSEHPHLPWICDLCGKKLLEPQGIGNACSYEAWLY